MNWETVAVASTTVQCGASSVGNSGNPSLIRDSPSATRSRLRSATIGRMRTSRSKSPPGTSSTENPHIPHRSWHSSADRRNNSSSNVRAPSRTTTKPGIASSLRSANGSNIAPTYRLMENPAFVEDSSRRLHKRKAVCTSLSRVSGRKSDKPPGQGACSWSRPASIR